MSEKVLSIIIPTYNMENYISKCLDSLLVPSIDQIEVLVINDGSKDKSSEIAHKYADKYPESIRIIDKENGHYGSCINRGLKEATGKYIKILDSDDYFDSKVFEDFISFLKHCNSDIIFTDYNIVNPKGQIIEKRKIPKLRNEQKDDLSDAIDILTNPLIAMHAVTYKLKKLHEISYRQSEGVPYTDQEWIYTPIFYMNSCAQFPLSLYHYIEGREGQSVDSSVILKNMHIQIMLITKRLEIYEDLHNKLDETRKEFAFYRLYFALVKTYKTLIFGNFDPSIMNSLYELDQKIKVKFPELFNVLNNLNLKENFPFKFIKYWRFRYPRKKRLPIINLIKIYTRFGI